MSGQRLGGTDTDFHTEMIYYELNWTEQKQARTRKQNPDNEEDIDGVR